MILGIRSTDVIVRLDGVLCRHWIGVTPDGREVDVYVHRIGTADAVVQATCEAELLEQPKPEVERAEGGA